MPHAYSQLAQALRDRLAIVADRDLASRDPAAHLEQLKAVSEKIAQLGGALPSPVPGDLAHYLQRASYEKALAWLEANRL
jgi:hypothetical protein